MTEQYIKCPNCNTNILFDLNSLLLGTSFACGGCGAKIKLSEESKEVVSESIEKFKRIKANALKS